MRKMQVSRRGLVVAAGTFAVTAASRATTRVEGEGPTSSLPLPTQNPILRISGKIRTTNEAGIAVFDRPMLEGLGLETITTHTPWYDGPVRFDGVPMARLMEAVGADGQSLTAIALNDYSTDIPISDLARFGVLLATQKAGAPMRVSDRGPLFIVYPYDSDAELRKSLYYSRSAWSVAQLVVR